jgi:hypothetical protein
VQHLPGLPESILVEENLMRPAKYILISVSRDSWIKKSREEHEATGGEMDAEDLIFLALTEVFKDPGAVTIEHTFEERPDI